MLKLPLLQLEVPTLPIFVGVSRSELSLATGACLVPDSAGTAHAPEIVWTAEYKQIARSVQSSIANLRCR